jgi:hypothetical protein
MPIKPIKPIKRRVKRAEKPVNLEHTGVCDGGTWKVETVDSTWGTLPVGSDEETPGAVLTTCHADPDAPESVIALDAGELDNLIDSLIEARAVLTKRHKLEPGKFA